jgi:hypothetical protein
VRDLKVKTEGREKSLLGQGRKDGEKGQDDLGEQKEAGSELPSSYCTMYVCFSQVAEVYNGPDCYCPIIEHLTTKSYDIIFHLSV